MSQQQLRYQTTLKYTQVPVNIRSKRGYPTVYQQADDIGGKFSRIYWGLPENSVANFSPCLVNHQGHRLISFRSQPQPFVFRHDRKYFYYNNTPTEIYIGELTSENAISGAKKSETSRTGLVTKMQGFSKRLMTSCTCSSLRAHTPRNGTAQSTLW